MEVPSMAIGGSAPTLSPLLVVFLVMAAAGAFLSIAALLLHNLRLVTQHGLNPFSLADIQRVANTAISTRRAGSPPFHRSTYGRVALTLLTVGAAGVIVMLLLALFGG